VIRATGLAYAYRNELVVDGVDISASAGEMVGLVGPNGSGKSTVLSLLAGILTPRAGRVRVSNVTAIAHGDIVPIDFFYTGHGLLAIDGLEQLADRLEN